MKNTKVISMVLCCLICISSLGTVFGNIASKKSDMAPEANVQKEVQDINNKNVNNEKRDTSISKKVIKFEKKNAEQKDIYNFSGNDIEKLLIEGYSVEDIILADNIGNEIVVDPKELLKKSKEENKKLDEIKSEIVNKRIEKRSSENQKANATISEKNQSDGLTNGELEQLESISQKNGQKLEVIVQKFKDAKSKIKEGICNE